MKTYIYKGDGAGIPGLPHRLTEDEVKALPKGLADQFKSALEAGAYGESVEAQHPAPKPETPSRKSKAGTAPDEKE